MNTSQNHRFGRLVGGLIAAWFVGVVSASALSIFKEGPVPAGAAALSPIVVFLVWFGASPAFRQFILSLDVRILTALQSWRVAGFTFVVAAAYGILPKAFALPAGWGDIAIGLTAPFVAHYLVKPGHKLSFIAWQTAGILDLAMAVTLGVLASPRIQVLGNGLTTEPLTVLPLSVIPTFAVPVVVIFHIICIAHAGHLEVTSGVTLRGREMTQPLPQAR